MNFIKNFIFLSLIFLFINIGTTSIQAEVQHDIKFDKLVVKIELFVVDKSGKFIHDVNFYNSNERIHSITDTKNRKHSFNAKISDYVTISSPGYEELNIAIENLLGTDTLSLVETELQLNLSDIVYLPFNNIKKRYATGGYNIIPVDLLEKYPTTDFRNSLTGIANGVEVREMDGQPGTSVEEENLNNNNYEKVSVLSRGLNLTYIIDDVPMNATEIALEQSDIRSITVLKDPVAKNMYGPLAGKGVVFIKTKRGVKQQRSIKLNVETGYSTIDRMPGWVNGAEYATINNLARVEDGLDPLYNDDAILSYSRNDPYNIYHPSINFKELMLKESRPFNKASISYSGGSENFQHFSSLSYAHEGDNYKIGSESSFNRISMRTNLDLKVADQINVHFDIFGNVNYRNSPNYGFNSSNIVEMTSVLQDITRTPPIAFPIYVNQEAENNIVQYAVSNSYKSNPIGKLSNSGYYTETGRNSATNLALDYDMGELIKGLKSRTFFGFNVFNLTRIGKSENYEAYIISPDIADSTYALTKVHDGVYLDKEEKLRDYYYQRFMLYETLSYDKEFGDNSLNTTLTFNANINYKSGVKEPQRGLSGIWTGSYLLDKKYFIQGVLNYSGNYWLSKENRWKLFPSIGISWIISEEDFMSDISFVDFLKLRAEVGTVGVENYLSPYLYSSNWTVSSTNNFGPYPANQWFGTRLEDNVIATSVNRISNGNLDWETISEFSIGMETLLFKQKLSTELNFYNNLRKGQIFIANHIIPDVAGVSNASLYANLRDVNYYGLELSIQYSDKIGKMSYSLGGNASVQNSKFSKFDEPKYRYDYQSRIGKPVDAFFGHTFIGKYETVEEANQYNSGYDAKLSPGDLKYKDMNNDGTIDDFDMSWIGNTSPRLFYALNARFNYQDFDLFINGTGRAFYDIAMTNSYFHNGWGDNNYSNFVKDNIGGAYPRLTYYKVNNNFVSSDFWLKDGGYFKIQNIELGYHLSGKLLKFFRVKGARFYVRGANILTISKIKDVDPESINAGVSTYPLNKTYTCGITLNM